MPLTPGTSTIDPLQTIEDGEAKDDAAGETAIVARPVSNLAALLDRFTAAVTNPEAETIGSFAATVDALHGELAMLARHFRADVGEEQEAVDLDALFPDTANAADCAGISEAEALDHLCRKLSGA